MPAPVGRLLDAALDRLEKVSQGLPQLHEHTHLQDGEDPFPTPSAPVVVDPNVGASAGIGPGYALSDHRHAEDLHLTTKGDILTRSTSAYVRQGVGSDGSSLRAASAATTGIEWQKNNFGASAAPTTGDDSGDGYSVGSRWLDTTADKEYVCTDATAAAAVWKETTAAGAGVAGLAVLALPEMVAHAIAGSFSAGSNGFQIPIRVCAPMKLRGLRIRSAGAGSGTHEWGLFDASADATAAVKLAGGTGTISGAGWQTIAATSAPVDIAAGAYFVVFKWPAANFASIYYDFVATGQTPVLPPHKSQAAYTWDDTPDLTSGWTSEGASFFVALIGDLDGSGHQW
jgi:hypothetical protein